MTENEDIELELKREGTTAETVSSTTADNPPYAEIETKAPPDVAEELMNQNNPPAGEYSKVELNPDDSEPALPAKPSRQVILSGSMHEEMVSSPMYQDMDQHPSTVNVPQETDIYNMPSST